MAGRPPDRGKAQDFSQVETADLGVETGILPGGSSGGNLVHLGDHGCPFESGKFTGIALPGKGPGFFAGGGLVG